MTELTLESPHAPLDRDLLVRVQRRNPAAMNVFFEAFIDRVYAYVVGLVRDEVMADDLVQDAFVRLHGAIDRLDPGRDPSGWVFTVVTNVVRDHWRSRAHRQRGSMVDVDAAWDLADSDTERPDRQLEAGERDHSVRAALERLSPADREVVLLKQYEGLKAPEIATILDVSPEAVRQRYSRAVRRLGSAYRELFGEERP